MKLLKQETNKYLVDVAPRTGAWIETSMRSRASRSKSVAPRTGAWIETFYFARLADPGPSPPARGRGLKRLGVFNHALPGAVAPRTGAWIETTRRLKGGAGPFVAPRTGAWIETFSFWGKFTGAWIETKQHEGLDWEHPSPCSVPRFIDSINTR